MSQVQEKPWTAESQQRQLLREMVERSEVLRQTRHLSIIERTHRTQQVPRESNLLRRGAAATCNRAKMLLGVREGNGNTNNKIPLTESFLGHRHVAMLPE